ncbi:MAG: hypothetical protein ACRDH6_06660 [Actinomycetota bacterium]
MPAVAVPVALLLGAMADLVAGVARRLMGGRQDWLHSVSRLPSQVRRIAAEADQRDGWERPAVIELVGAGGALLGAGTAAAAALGFGPGSAGLVYLSLLLAAIGGHVAASLPATYRGEERATRARLSALLVEPAFLLALVAAFARWGAPDVEAVRGAQIVLGSGLTLGPALSIIALALSTLVLIASGSARIVPSSEGMRGRSRGGGSALLVTAARWGATGATALVVSVFVAGSAIPPPSIADGRFLAWVGALLSTSLLLGLGQIGAAILRIRGVEARAGAVIAGVSALAVALAVAA